jgi:hypothetical protein
MSVYTGNIPQPGDIPSESQPLILQNFTYLVNTLGKDHDIASGDVDSLPFEGRHLQVSLFGQVAPITRNTVGDSTNAVISAVSGDLYLSSVNGPNVSWQLTTTKTGGTPGNDNAFFGDLSTNNGGLNGFTFLPGGLIMNYGAFTVTANTTTAVLPFSNMGINFATKAINIQATVSSNSNTKYSVSALIISNTQFTITNPNSVNLLIYVTAIGF